jgi:CheY-like chemotaxis protein
MGPKTILVVDDDPAIAALLTSALGDLGVYRTMAARSGAEALSRIAGQCPDLILLDIALPDLDGFALRDVLRLRHGTGALPILFMTVGQHEAAFQRRGVRDWLRKPFGLAELFRRVEPLLLGQDASHLPPIGR